MILNNTSNEYTIQDVKNANSYLGTIASLQQVSLAIYGTYIIPFSYTGSKSIDITNNEISLNFPIKINNEVVSHPRAYGGAVFDMLSSTDTVAYQQISLHGGTPIAQFY